MVIIPSYPPPLWLSYLPVPLSYSYHTFLSALSSCPSSFLTLYFTVLLPIFPPILSGPIPSYFLPSCLPIILASYLPVPLYSCPHTFPTSYPTFSIPCLLGCYLPAPCPSVLQASCSPVLLSSSFILYPPSIIHHPPFSIHQLPTSMLYVPDSILHSFCIPASCILYPVS